MNKQVECLYGNKKLSLKVPGDSIVYESGFPDADGDAKSIVQKALNAPYGSMPLHKAINYRRPGSVVIVVSDITRPIPYTSFLAELCTTLEENGVSASEIVILIATGMHRPSTSSEREEMFGLQVTRRYTIVDHRADDESSLVTLSDKSISGADIRLNRTFTEAGFRIITGLVEPHFMAGFSGGRKSVCPGLSSLDTIRLFHGYTFLSNPHAQNAVLSGNPCHEESLSVARAVGVDFSLNVVLNRSRDVIAAFAGSLVAAHDAACTFAASGSVQTVTAPADIAVVSSGGYPLDATFYQCVKGFVSCLAALKPNGTIIAFGSCAEGIGSPEYTHTMQKYANDDWRLFLKDIEDPSNFTKDQWQFQMHCKALEKVGISRLHFISSGLTNTDLNSLSVNGHSVDEKNLENEIHNLLSKLYNNGMRIAVFPEGPYCVPTVSQ